MVIRAGIEFGEFGFDDFYTEAGAFGKRDVAVFADFPVVVDQAWGIVFGVEFVDEKEGDAEAGMEAGGGAEHGHGAMWSQGDEVGFSESSNFFDLADASGVSAIGLEHVEAAFLKIGEHAPDGAVPFSGGHRDADVLFEAFEHFDISGNGDFFKEEQIVGFNGVGELDEGGRWNGAVSVKHDGTFGTDPLSAVFDHANQGVDGLGVPGIGPGTSCAEFEGMRCWVDAKFISGWPSKQSIHWNAPGFAGNVPKGHVDTGEHVGHEGATPHVSMGTVNLLPEVFDAGRVFSDQEF